MAISEVLYELPFAVRCIVFPTAVLLACAVLRIIANSLPRQSPPVFEGIPFIGGLLKFIKVKSHPLNECEHCSRSRPKICKTLMSNGLQGPMSLMEQGFKRHGEVFTVPVLSKNITFLIGTDVTPYFFKATDEDMSQQEV